MAQFFSRVGTRRPEFLLLAFTIVAACSSAPGASTPAGSGPAAAATPTAPSIAGGGVPAMNCQTLSAADLVTIVGRDVAGANPFGDLACTWVFADKASGGKIGPEARIYVRFSGDDPMLKILKSANPGGQDVSIADGGYWVESDSSLYVAKGARAYAISLSGFDPADPRQEMAIEIARLLLAKV